ncbi:MAG: hypothetical protein RJA70_1677 [Pseudomonadota bacterium]|jgi:hypothetical protein
MQTHKSQWLTRAVLVVISAVSFGACQKPAPAPAKVPEPTQMTEAPDTTWDAADAGTEPNSGNKRKKEPELRRSARPELKLRNDSKIQASVDSSGAELILGAKAALVFPVSALSSAVAYSFAQRQGPVGPKRIGLNYTFGPAVTSAGEPFVLELPLPEWAKEANFAIVHLTGEKRKMGWVVVAPTRVDSKKGVAVLETPELPDGMIYLTSDKPD